MDHVTPDEFARLIEAVKKAFDGYVARTGVDPLERFYGAK
jgi:hypothetical protein